MNRRKFFKLIPILGLFGLAAPRLLGNTNPVAKQIFTKNETNIIKFIQVEVKKIIEEFFFEINCEKTRLKIELNINNFLKNLSHERKIYNYKIIMPEQDGFLYFQLQIQQNNSVEWNIIDVACS